MDRLDTTAEAATLLLRSPRWSVTRVMELLEIGDAEFRELVAASRFPRPLFAVTAVTPPAFGFRS